MEDPTEFFEAELNPSSTRVFYRILDALRKVGTHFHLLARVPSSGSDIEVLLVTENESGVAMAVARFECGFFSRIVLPEGRHVSFVLPSKLAVKPFRAVNNKIHHLTSMTITHPLGESDPLMHLVFDYRNGTRCTHVFLGEGGEFDLPLQPSPEGSHFFCIENKTLETVVNQFGGGGKGVGALQEQVVLQLELLNPDSEEVQRELGANIAGNTGRIVWKSREKAERTEAHHNQNAHQTQQQGGGGRERERDRGRGGGRGPQQKGDAGGRDSGGGNYTYIRLWQDDLISFRLDSDVQFGTELPFDFNVRELRGFLHVATQLRSRLGFVFSPSTGVVVVKIGRKSETDPYHEGAEDRRWVDSRDRWEASLFLSTQAGSRVDQEPAQRRRPAPAAASRQPTANATQTQRHAPSQHQQQQQQHIRQSQAFTQHGPQPTQPQPPAPESQFQPAAPSSSSSSASVRASSAEYGQAGAWQAEQKQEESPPGSFPSQQMIHGGEREREPASMATDTDGPIGDPFAFPSSSQRSEAMQEPPRPHRQAPPAPSQVKQEPAPPQHPRQDLISSLISSVAAQHPATIQNRAAKAREAQAQAAEAEGGQESEDEGAMAKSVRSTAGSARGSKVRGGQSLRQQQQQQQAAASAVEDAAASAGRKQKRNPEPASVPDLSDWFFAGDADSDDDHQRRAREVQRVNETSNTEKDREREREPMSSGNMPPVVSASVSQPEFGLGFNGDDDDDDFEELQEVVMPSEALNNPIGTHNHREASAYQAGGLEGEFTSADVAMASQDSQEREAEEGGEMEEGNETDDPNGLIAFTKYFEQLNAKSRKGEGVGAEKDKVGERDEGEESSSEIGPTPPPSEPSQDDAASEAEALQPNADWDLFDTLLNEAEKGEGEIARGPAPPA